MRPSRSHWPKLNYKPQAFGTAALLTRCSCSFPSCGLLWPKYCRVPYGFYVNYKPQDCLVKAQNAEVSCRIIHLKVLLLNYTSPWFSCWAIHHEVLLLSHTPHGSLVGPSTTWFSCWAIHHMVLLLSHKPHGSLVEPQTTWFSCWATNHMVLLLNHKPQGYLVDRDTSSLTRYCYCSLPRNDHW